MSDWFLSRKHIIQRGGITAKCVCFASEDDFSYAYAALVNRVALQVFR